MNFLKNAAFTFACVLTISCGQDVKKSTENNEATEGVVKNTTELDTANTGRSEEQTTNVAFVIQQATSGWNNDVATRVINIPKKQSSSGTVLYKPSLQTRVDFTDLGNQDYNIVFELYQHNNVNRDNMCSDPLDIDTDTFSISQVLPQFNPQKPLVVVAMHNEDFQNEFGDPTDPRYMNLKGLVQDYVRGGAQYICDWTMNPNFNTTAIDSLNIKLKLKDVRPRTIGGGVIPPR